MRFRFVGFCRLALAMASLGCAAGCAARGPAAANAGSTAAGPQVSGVWDAVTSATIDEGVAAGDVRIEKQEWHLSQSGSAIRGYYIAALTYVSGDGRPYVCSRQPQFSAFQRFEVAGQVQARRDRDSTSSARRRIAKENRCDPGMRQLARYRGLLDGDVMTLVSGRQQTRLYRIHASNASMPSERVSTDSGPRLNARATSNDSPAVPAVRAMTPPMMSTPGAANADVSGLWVWEHQGSVPGGDQKQEREEWHVEQDRLEDLRLLRSHRPPGVDRRARLSLQHGAGVSDRDPLPVQRRRAAATTSASSRARTRFCRPAPATTASAAWTSTRARSRPTRSA